MTKTNEPKPTYAINALKQMNGSDGVVFNCNILKNGKKIATVHQGGYGAENEYHFDNVQDEKDFTAASDAHKATLTGDDAKYFDLDGFLEVLIQAYEAPKENARITKWAKKFVAECRAKNFTGDYLIIRKNGSVCAISPIRATTTVEEQGAAAVAKNKATSWERYNGEDNLIADTKPAETMAEQIDAIKTAATEAN